MDISGVLSQEDTIVDDWEEMEDLSIEEVKTQNGKPTNKDEDIHPSGREKECKPSASGTGHTDTSQVENKLEQKSDNITFPHKNTQEISVQLGNNNKSGSLRIPTTENKPIKPKHVPFGRNFVMTINEKISTTDILKERGRHMTDTRKNSHASKSGI